MRRVSLKPFSPIEGTLPECVVHFAESQGFRATGPGSSKSYRARNTIATIIGITHQTGRVWFSKGEQFPSGVNHLRLLYFMTTLGYRVREIEDIPNGEARWMSQFIGLQIVSTEEIASKYGGKREHVLGVIRGEARFTDAQWDMLEPFLKDKEGEIAAAKAKILEILGMKPSQNGVQSPIATAPAVASMHLESDKIVDACACLLSSVFPLVEHFSLSATSEERRLLREKIGSKTMFLISTHFNRLCSEQARKEELKKEKQHAVQQV